jgi:hypothetical protein
MKRKYNYKEKDQIIHEILELEASIARYEAMDERSEWEEKSLQMDKLKLRHLKNM